MKIQKSKINIYSPSQTFKDIFSLKYAPHSRLFSNQKNEKQILIYFLSHENTEIINGINLGRDSEGFFHIYIKTNEPKNNKGNVIAVQVLIECKDYSEIILEIKNKKNIIIGILNTDTKIASSDYRHGGLPTDPIPTYPPFAPTNSLFDGIKK
ncbi:hypothetical protein [uncultured Polaribacter sp.]|uniref:hypothetical protein n=1 Tax=uncultured Polaribacter sp. TaxID=174711 RepID=UPI002624D8B7|nr:hypothetical protein [uncultured Polaribacter sp.]